MRPIHQRMHEFSRWSYRLAAATGPEFNKRVHELLSSIWPGIADTPGTDDEIIILRREMRTELVACCLGFASVIGTGFEELCVRECRRLLSRALHSEPFIDYLLLIHNRDGRSEQLPREIGEALRWLVSVGRVSKAEIWDRHRLLKETLPFVLFAQDSEDLIEIPRFFIEANTLWLREAISNPALLRSMPSRRFEEFMAEIFCSLGFQIELTAPTRDGGADLIAIRQIDGINLKLIVECKRYVPPNKVGVEHVRQLLGVKADSGASKGVIATTSYFTKPAKEFESRHKYELELKDFDAIAEWSSEYRRQIERAHNTDAAPDGYRRR